MEWLVKILLEAVIVWIEAHPDAALSRFVLKRRGPRTDVRAMNRLQRLISGLSFLCWGALFFGLWLLTAYLTFEIKLFSPDEALTQVMLIGLAVATGMGGVAGVYLLLRAVFN